ncbi:hypothetical protein M9Y10_003586 [Tritrichomonas musculus]|uniref:Uncharacterized protein n=1 Tax=Tritrichomonas musculus TaxID=1915356 RepID=A0ABR2JQ95_9EUKA
MPPRKKDKKAKLDLQYVGDITYPQLEHTIVHRYKKYRGNDKHYYVICAETLFNDDGVRCQCSMDYTREDHFKLWLMRNEHICTPGKEVDQMTLLDFIRNEDGSRKVTITEDRLYEQMAIFTGKKNLSLDVLASDEFYEMACMFIAFGLTLSCSHDPINIARKAFNQIGRDKLRYIMMNTAYRKHRATLNKFTALPYASVSMDEGSTQGISTLHFVVESPLTNLKSYPFYPVRMDGGKANDYIKSIPRGLRHLQLAGASIGSIVVDGNTAQLKALSPTYKKSLYNQSDINDMEKILIIPCLCHRINNSYKRIAQKNEHLKKLLETLHTLSVQYRDSRKEIGALCPAHNDTRWCYDYDIVKFILDHRKKALEARIRLDEIPIMDFEKLKKVLQVFKVLVSTFENPHTKMKDSFIIIERAINCLNELRKKLNVKYAEELARSLEEYTLMAKDGGIWSLAYCLSPEGQADIRERNIHSANPIEYSYLKYFHIDDEEEDTDSNEDDEDEPVVTFKSSDEILMTINGQLVNVGQTDSDDDDFYEDSDNEEEEIEENVSEEEVLPDPNFKNYLKSAKTMLKEFLQLRKLNSEKVKKAVSLFNKYMEDPQPFEDYMIGNDSFTWTQIKNTEEGWSDIGDIAERLLSSVTSEASCERAISRHRLIHTNRREKSKKELLDVRMILEST